MHCIDLNLDIYHLYILPLEVKPTIKIIVPNLRWIKIPYLQNSLGWKLMFFEWSTWTSRVCIYKYIYIYIWLSIQRLHCRFVASLFFVQKKNFQNKESHPNRARSIRFFLFVFFSSWFRVLPITIRITGPCYRGVWMCIAGVWDLQTTSFEIPWFLGYYRKTTLLWKHHEVFLNGSHHSIFEIELSLKNPEFARFHFRGVLLNLSCREEIRTFVNCAQN